MEKKQTNGLGVAAMVIGIIAFLLSCCRGAGLLGIVGLILGIVGLTKKNQGKGMAITGVILSSLAIIVALFTLSSGGLGEYIQKSKDAQNDSSQQVEVTNNDTSDENGPEITLDEFNQIETGMTYEEVVNIIGSEGTLTSETTVGDITSKMYSWNGKSIASNATFLFQNDSLTSKSQLNLD